MSGKRILLVNLPFYRLMGSHYNGLNVGLCYISAVLNERGHTCSVYNADYLESDTYADQIQLIDEFEHYKEVHEDHDHRIWKETEETILSYEPDYVGFSILTANYPAAQIVAERLKRVRPDIRIVVGGAHATVAGDTLLAECGDFDFVVAGEGEYVLRDLLEGGPPAGIAGLIRREDGRIAANEPSPRIDDLDALPHPDRSHFYPGDSRYDLHYVSTSRGCPNHCTFCASPLIWDGRVKFRSVGNVIDELKKLKSMGINLVRFQDDTFTFNKKRLLAIMEEMTASCLDMEWVCDTCLISLDEEVLKAMKRAGCVRVKVGVESGSREILRRIRKGITPELAIEKTALVRKAGIGLTAYFMIGFPGETDEQALETIELAKKIGADYYSLSIVAPYYGTAMYREFVDAGGKESVKEHWEYFFNQNREWFLNSDISEETFRKFLALNELGKGKRL